MPAADPTPEPAEPPRRIIAFDVGARRIGVALTDPLGYTVQPLLTLHVTGRRDDWRSIGRLLRRHNVAEAVVGHPVHLSGDPSPRSALSEPSPPSFTPSSTSPSTSSTSASPPTKPTKSSTAPATPAAPTAAASSTR